ncbi:MAG: hypothetical protein MZV63_64425 [Marinilabiliales bacterium]|nr:hypothetical protein [Marinilabiliales bacterium]
MKYAFLVGDGMADRPVSRSWAARRRSRPPTRRTWTEVAGRGRLGRIRTVPAGLAAGQRRGQHVAARATTRRPTSRGAGRSRRPAWAWPLGAERHGLPLQPGHARAAG